MVVVVISHSNPPHHPHPQNLSHIYDTLTFMFECQGWGGGGWLFLIQPPPPPHPQNFSHIYDTLTFMFECQGWGGGGVYKKWGKKFTDSKLNVEHPQHLSHIYDTLTFMFECWGWGHIIYIK